MREKIEYAKNQAKDAREKALLCRDKAIQDEWFKVAHLWDELAGEYGECEKLRARWNGAA